MCTHTISPRSPSWSPAPHSGLLVHWWLPLQDLRLSKIFIWVGRFWNLEGIHGFNIFGKSFSIDILVGRLFLQKLRSKIFNTFRFTDSYIDIHVSGLDFHILERFLGIFSSSIVGPSFPFFKLERMNLMNIDSFYVNVRFSDNFIINFL